MKILYQCAMAGARRMARSVSACVIIMAALAVCSSDEPELAKADVGLRVEGDYAEDTVRVTFGLGYGMDPLSGRAGTRGDLEAAVTRRSTRAHSWHEYDATVF